MAETIDGAPNIAAIPAVIPIIKPQEILPVKKPTPAEMIANAANALPALPVTTFNTLQRVLKRTLLSEVEVIEPEVANASAEIAGSATGATAKKKKDKREIFAKKAENFFINFYKI